MYRGAIYNALNRELDLYTWDDNGNRIVRSIPFEPYIYLETSSNPDCYSIYGTPVKKKVFKSAYDRSQYVERGETKRIFENLPVVQQALIDIFWKENESPEFTKYPLKICFLDIETYSPGAFPNVDEANDTINIITVYNNIDQSYHTWGIGKLNRELDIKNFHYHECATEEILLQYFIEYIHKEQFDIMSGWNYILFDMPYLINRINRVLGEDYIRKLSPTGRVYTKSIRDDFGRLQTRFFLEGVSSIDFLDIYKKFCYSPRESYRLDAIGEIELGEGKTDYGSDNLATLAEEDWDTFVQYNVQDVSLLVKLENKLRYFTLLRMIAYAGLTTFEAALGTVGPVSGALAIQARKRNQVIPTFPYEDTGSGKIPGAFVSEPLRGFQTDVVSFDATSLYPSIMMSLNLSPETKVGWIIDKTDNHVTIRTVGNNKNYTLPIEKWNKFIEKEKIIITAANVLFTYKKKGIVPEMVEHYFQTRIDTNKQLDKVELALSQMDKRLAAYKKLKYEKEYLDAKQMSLKIFINSAYGYFANKHSHLGDKDIAKSITLTGQEIIKKTNNIIEDFFEKHGISRTTHSHIYNDTDSSYLTLTPILKSKNIPLQVDGVVTSGAREIINNLQTFINEEINNFVKNNYKTNNSKIIFKREVIADVCLFLEKKRYIMHVIDEKNIAVSKFKYKGVDVVRSTMPGTIKPLVKNIIETMLLSRSKESTDEAFYKTYEEFMKLELDQIVKIVGMSDYSQKESKCSGWNTVKGMPSHMKGAYFYNKLLKEYNITDKYPLLGDGDKVRFFYVKVPNKYNINCIAYKRYFPTELKDIIAPDYELMFEKMIYSAIERLYEVVNWKLRKPSERVRVDLLSFFKE